MQSGEAVERSQELTLAALRRAFLIDMTWPVGTDVICEMFGLPKASEEVVNAEVWDSQERMSRFTDNGALCALLHHAAEDAADVLNVVDDREGKIAWLATYALAVMNLLQTAGYVEVTPG
jgi:hypothetical protein